MTRFISKVLLIIVISTTPFIALSQTVLNDSIMNGPNFEKAAFRLWIHKDIKKIRGIIVMVPGSNGDGRNRVEKTAWQNLAKEHN
ncbi:MAG: hypothetical protein MI810_16125, partial [Flavobacteriales bacterium]|nr:hypothetical protein [Flavobacteriales bacterium]